MNKTVKIAGLAAAVVLPATAIAGIAQAQTHRAPAVQHATSASEQPGGTDSDNIQEGDQTSPDGTMKQAVPQSAHAAVAHPAKAVGQSLKAVKGATKVGGAAGQSGTGTTQSGTSTGPADEGSGEGEVSGESGGAGDGPGGHQDPAGDVNHEFDGEE